MLEEIIKTDKKYYMNTFGDRLPVCFNHGSGMNLYADDGRVFTDFFAGIAVNALGYNHPEFIQSLKNQLNKLLHTSSLYYIENQATLAKMLVDISCADKVFFANSGAEANEGAIKLAKIYFYKKGMENKNQIITLNNSFHGRTLATLSATGQHKYQKPYKPLTPGFKHVRINDFEELTAAADDNTAAIILELVQGESGVHPIDIEYAKKLRQLCDQKSILLIIDEVQTGMGRTGKMFAYQNYGIEPDIFTLAKALGGGIPIGAVLAKDFVASAFEPGDHGSTFGGNPFATAAGISVLNIIQKENLVSNAKEMGEYFIKLLTDLLKKHSSISEVRGMGLMIAIDFINPIAKSLCKKLFDMGFLLGAVGDKTLRLLPPLIVTKRDIEKLITALDLALNQL